MLNKQLESAKESAKIEKFAPKSIKEVLNLAPKVLKWARWLQEMVQTIFYLPGYLKDNQKRLEELAAKYNLDLEKEIAEAEIETKELSDKNEKEQNSLKVINNEKLIKELKKVK